jgi:autotransporter translocation and assembly factor TamB
MRKTLRVALRVVLWSLFGVVALIGSASYHIELQLARRIARDFLNEFVTHEIRGELAIGRFDELSLEHAVARHVFLYDGEGRRIISAERVEVDPDLAQLRHGVLHFRVGRIYGGTVRLVSNESGDPSLFTTFEPRHPGSGGGAEPLHALVDRIELHDLTLYGQVVELHGVRAEHIYAAGRLEVAHTVEIAIARAHGKLVLPFDFVGNIEQLSGTISTDPMRGVKLDARARRDLEQASAHIEYRSLAPSLPQELELTILSPSVSPDTLRRMGFAFAQPLAPLLHGQVHLAGPPSQLELEAQVESEAGGADVHGMVTGPQGLSVQISSPRLVVDKLIEGAPSVTARGILIISVPAPDESPHLHAELAALNYRGLLVPPFELDGVMEPDGIRIERARATQGGQISVRGRAGFDGRSDLRIDAHFATVQRDPNLSRYVDNLEGTLTAAVRVRTPPSKQHAQLDVSGRVELRDAQYGSLHAKSIELSGTMKGDPALPKVNLQVKADEFAVLSYNFGAARFSLRGGPHDYTAQGEFVAKGQKTFAFNAVVAADLQGFVVQADPIEFTVGDASWRGLVRDLKVVNERYVELGLLRLASRAQRLEASGILRVKGEHSLRAQLQNFDLTAVRALLGSERFPISHGYADANLEIRGAVARPILTVQGAVREAKLLNYDTIDALYAVDYQSGRVEFDSEVDLRGRGTLHLTGQGELDATLSDPREALKGGLYNLAFTSSNLDLMLVPRLKNVIEGGRVDGSLELQGGLDSITWTGNLTAKNLRFHGWQPIELATGFQFDHNELTSSMSAKDARGTLAKADVNVQVNWEALRKDPTVYVRQLTANDFQVQGQTLDRPISQLPFPVRWANAFPVRVESNFEFQRSDGRLSGSAHGVTRPEGQLSDATCKLSMSSELRSDWQLSAERVELAFEGLLDGHTVATGQGGVSWPFDAFLRGEQVSAVPSADFMGHADVDKLERAPGLCRHGRGQLHARWDLRSLFGEAPSAEIALKATLQPEVRVAAGETEQVVIACQSQPLQLDLSVKGAGDRIDIRGQSNGCSAGPSSLNAQIPVAWDAAHRIPQLDKNRELKAALQMQDAELKPLFDYLPGTLGFSARGNGRVTVSALHDSVDYRGQLTVTDGELYAVPMGQELHNIGVALTANGNWLKVESLHARHARGTLDADGGIGMERWWPRRIQMGTVLKDFPVEREGIELAWLTGSAAVIGDIERDRSRIAIKLHDLAVRLPDTSNRSPLSLDPHPDIALVTDAPRSQSSKGYDFEIAIDGRQQFSARRNDFEAALSAELAVQFQDPDLRVGGYFEFRRGTFDVFGKRFELNRGSMRFDGGLELNPEVNLVATHQPDTVGATPVYVNVSGTLDKPVVSFSSDQCPGEAAVVFLVSGRCPTEADTNSADTRSTAEAFGAGIVGGILTLGARRQLGGLIPQLSVESAAAGTRTRFKAGFEAVPKFMRPLVQRMYVQGAVSTPDNNIGGGGTTQTTTTPDFLIELYFPNNIVGAGKVAPVTRSWGLDVTWEP